MRWNASVTLVSLSVAMSEAGDAVTTRTEREVFCNAMTVSDKTWLAAMSAGLKAETLLEIRSEEYCGEQEAIYDGETCDIERVTRKGEFTRLQLARRVRSGR